MYCGRELRTGVKYCYVCRSIQRARKYNPEDDAEKGLNPNKVVKKPISKFGAIFLIVLVLLIFYYIFFNLIDGSLFSYILTIIVTITGLIFIIDILKDDSKLSTQQELGKTENKISLKKRNLIIIILD